MEGSPESHTLRLVALDSKGDKKVKLSAKRANEFAAKLIEADATGRETAKKARKEKDDDDPKPAAVE